MSTIMEAADVAVPVRTAYARIRQRPRSPAGGCNAHKRRLQPLPPSV